MKLPFENEVRCTGCGRLVGATTSATPPRVWCTDLACYVLPPTHLQQARDDYIKLAHALGALPHQLARMFNVSRARIHQILTGR